MVGVASSRISKTITTSVLSFTLHGRTYDRRLEELRFEGQEVVLEVNLRVAQHQLEPALGRLRSRTSTGFDVWTKKHEPPSLCIMKPGQVSMSAPRGISSAFGGRFSEFSEPGVTPPYEELSADASDPRAP